MDYSALPVHSFPVNQIAGLRELDLRDHRHPQPHRSHSAHLDRGTGGQRQRATSPLPTPPPQQIYQELIGLAPARGEGNATNGAGPEPDVLPAPASAFAQLRYFHAPLPDLSYRPTGDPHPRLPPGADRAQQLSRRPPPLPPGLRSDRYPSAGPARRRHQGAGDPDWTSALGVVEHRCLAVDGGHPDLDQFPPDPAGSRLPATGCSGSTTPPASRSPTWTPTWRPIVSTRSAWPSRPARPPVRAGRHSSYLGVAPGTTALTVPALRSAGPQVIWTGYATADDAGFAGLLDGQKTLETRPDRLARLADHRQSAGHLCRAAHPRPPLRRLHGLGGRAHLEEPVRPLRPVHLRAVRCPIPSLSTSLTRAP